MVANAPNMLPPFRVHLPCSIAVPPLVDWLSGIVALASGCYGHPQPGTDPPLWSGLALVDDIIIAHQSALLLQWVSLCMPLFQLSSGGFRLLCSGKSKGEQTVTSNQSSFDSTDQQKTTHFNNFNTHLSEPIALVCTHNKWFSSFFGFLLHLNLHVEVNSHFYNNSFDMPTWIYIFNETVYINWFNRVSICIGPLLYVLFLPAFSYSKMTKVIWFLM